MGGYLPERASRDQLLLVAFPLWQQTQFFRAFAKDLRQLLGIVGAGEGHPTFPARHVKRLWGTDQVCQLLLSPAALLACRPQQLIGYCLCRLFDHRSSIDASGAHARATEQSTAPTLKVRSHHEVLVIAR